MTTSAPPPPATPSPRRSLPLWALPTLVVVAMAIFLTWDAGEQYRRISREEFRHLGDQARSAESQLESSLRLIDLLLQQVGDDRRALPVKASAAQLIDLEQSMAARLRPFPEIRLLLTTTAQGLVDAVTNHAIKNFDASKREYFLQPRDSVERNRYFISRPFTTITGLRAVTVSRAFFDDHGKFAGVAVATVDPKYFDTLLRGVLPSGESGSAAVSQRPGRFAPSPAALANEGSNAGSPAFRAYMDSMQGTAQSRHVSPVDGADRYIGLSRRARHGTHRHRFPPRRRSAGLLASRPGHSRRPARHRCPADRLSGRGRPAPAARVGALPGRPDAVGAALGVRPRGLGAGSLGLGRAQQPRLFLPSLESHARPRR